MSLRHLKIKIKSLAMEARYIRREEHAVTRFIRWSVSKKEDTLNAQVELGALLAHRVHVVRPTARAALLAYAYLRGMSYERVEAPTTDPKRVPLAELFKNVKRFEPDKFNEESIRSWLTARSISVAA